MTILIYQPDQLLHWQGLIVNRIAEIKRIRKEQDDKNIAAGYELTDYIVRYNFSTYSPSLPQAPYSTYGHLKELEWLAKFFLTANEVTLTDVEIQWIIPMTT